MILRHLESFDQSPDNNKQSPLISIQIINQLMSISPPKKKQPNFKPFFFTFVGIQVPLSVQTV